MDTDEKAITKTGLILDALNYARVHHLDISKREDVIKIAEAIDPEHTSDEEVTELMQLLQHADTFMEIGAKEKQEEEAKLPN